VERLRVDLAVYLRSEWSMEQYVPMDYTKTRQEIGHAVSTMNLPTDRQTDIVIQAGQRMRLAAGRANDVFGRELTKWSVFACCSCSGAPYRFENWSK
jgi:hypothetical protein